MNDDLDQWQLIAVVLMHKFSKDGVKILQTEVDECFKEIGDQNKVLWANEFAGGFELLFMDRDAATKLQNAERH